MRDVRGLSEAELLEFVKCWRDDRAGITERLELSAEDASRLAKFLGVKGKPRKPSKINSEPEDQDEAACDPDTGLTYEEIERRDWLRGRYHRYALAFCETKLIVRTLVAEFNRKRQRPDKIAELQALQAESEARMRACGDMAAVVSELHATCPDVEARFKFETLYREMRDFGLIDSRRTAAMVELAALSKRMIEFDGDDIRTRVAKPLPNVEADEPRSKRQYRVSESLREAIVAMRQAGETGKSIAAAMGISVTTVWVTLRVGNPTRKIVSEIDKGRMRELRAQGVSAKDIAEQFGWTESTVFKIVGAIQRATPEEIRELYQQGYSITKICKELHVWKDRVREAIEDIMRPCLDARKLTVGDLHRARALLKRGVSTAVVALQIGTTWRTLSRHLGPAPKANIDIRGPGAAKIPLKKTLAIKHDILAGMSDEEVLAKHGVTTKLVEAIRPIAIDYDAVERAEMVDGIRSMIRSGYTEEEAAAEWRVSVKEVRKAITPHWSEKHINELWPAIFGMDQDQPSDPVHAPPGSVAKIEAMRKRWEVEVCPHHTRDAKEGDRVGHDILMVLGLA